MASVHEVIITPPAKLVALNPDELPIDLDNDDEQKNPDMIHINNSDEDKQKNPSTLGQPPPPLTPDAIDTADTLYFHLGSEGDRWTWEAPAVHRDLQNRTGIRTPARQQRPSSKRNQKIYRRRPALPTKAPD
ncbi:hypothetical protein PtA15_18A203 [Puccinia triticina]|uniref:WW domain-containing protein n=1 Tax=Puccinia triticina TaxID=208348 RepID=A0ABY7D7C0_9BASI|nr:uncharacterized protein PtA15_18A203 [Puccinia triticina]WAQ93145.1 hypothetical protein PtA15_18A203 [Puccinia triticina]WAR63128.1 hypothetical protein PtB15_18B210 [Puccinia triticina]